MRGVLRRPDGEFTTLGEEIELIESYLEIEHARFEERLHVKIDVPEALRPIRIPACSPIRGLTGNSQKAKGLA
ncbi:MAG: histidine kinase [Brachymonas sp.]|nr:histidine kinase [Brachymonas sp.]